MANQYTEFEVISFSHYTDILGGLKIKNVPLNHNHTPFGG